MFLESKYIGLLSNKLRNYRKLTTDKFQFSCPYCGDSKRRRNAARGSIFPSKGSLRFNCFNCGKTSSASSFIKEQDHFLYLQYLKEKISYQPVQDKPAKKEVKKEYRIENLKKISELPPFHDAVKYCRSRLIPVDFFDKMYYCEEFKSWTNSMLPRKFEEPIQKDEDRLIIPFFNEKGNLVAYIGRTLDPDNQLRYISIKLIEDADKIFGLNETDRSKKHYIVEGPIDSMFLPNCIAVADANLSRAANQNSVLVFDNQPRNKELCKQIKKAIDMGFKVVVWPRNFAAKDINDAVLQQIDVLDVISKNEYNGLTAKMKFNDWCMI